MAPTVPYEAFQKFEDLQNRLTDQLRKITKSVQDARQQQQGDDMLKKYVDEFDQTLDHYIPVLMAQAKIYWDMDNYQQVGHTVHYGCSLVTVLNIGREDIQEVSRVLS